MWFVTWGVIGRNYARGVFHDKIRGDYYIDRACKYVPQNILYCTEDRDGGHVFV